jgi:hypothetical protein
MIWADLVASIGSVVGRMDAGDHWRVAGRGEAEKEVAVTIQHPPGRFGKRMSEVQLALTM